MRASIWLAAVVLLSACAARVPARPTSAGRTDPTAVDAFITATRQCQGFRSMTAALRLSGRAGDERMRGTLLTGVEAPASLRVEAVAPFGQPFFILAGRDNRATLLLPRDGRVLAATPVPEVLERLTGLALNASDLRLILSGCLTDQPSPRDGRAYDGGWQAVTLDAGITAYLRVVDGRPVVIAADHGDWRVDYAVHEGAWPRRVRIRSVRGDVDLSAEVADLEVNTAIDARAFEVAVPADAAPIALDQLRAVTPLRGTK